MDRKKLIDQSIDYIMHPPCLSSPYPPMACLFLVTRSRRHGLKRAEEYAAQIESPMEMLRSANTLTVDSLRASCADEVVFLQYKTGD